MNELEPTTTGTASEESELSVSRWAYRSPEQKRIDAEKALSRAWPARPLPEGMKWTDVFRGFGPGDETDEQVTEDLRKLS